jgi:hypothetical protein
MLARGVVQHQIDAQADAAGASAAATASNSSIVP